MQGVDFKMRTLEVDGIKVRVQIWDTAGQERYQTITKQYYRRAQGIILVYDITSSSSFQHILKWASDVDEFAPDKVQRVLVGNKADEEQMRKVPKEQGSKLAKTYGMEFFETSACTNCNINEENYSGSPHFNSLRYVRPGDGYQPGFTVFEKRDVNGTNTHPVFVYLNDKLPYPDDDDPHSLTQDPKFLTWSTISRTDILRNSWLCQKGEPFKRYSKKNVKLSTWSLKSKA
ncbi:ras-related protein Rab-15 isoform X2 [Oncorhynchus mykiss]|uniref:ras-related protein Rab-15 isoform X2 n=1 Tax=Oncorhynchus mykiss TaxID=8022 RepID=UPI001878F129|nr:ras-related protein Rab-15 isoform X2 [Oncorhynchus mykiss]XP_036818411.1 ras-related protein Rab-15 isoform X2 [Oncorhynchus mykiss]